MVPARLPGFSGVIAKFLLLYPHVGLGEKIDSSHVVPVGMTDHHIGDVLGFHTRKAHGLVGPQVILDGPFLEPALPMKAAVEENISPTAADEPKDVNGVDFLVLGCTD